MTSRERMCKAIQKETPDRIPTFEYAIDRKVVEHFCPGGEYADVVEELDLDGITAWEPSMGGYAKGLKTRTPGEVFIDEWGVTRKATAEMSAFPVEEGAPIGTKSDLVNYCLPDPDSPHRYSALAEYVQRFKGDKLITYNIVDMFETTKCLLGFQHFLLSVNQDLELLKSAYGVVTDWIIEVARKAVDRGAEMIIINGDLGFKTGTFIHPRVLGEIHMPHLHIVAEAIKDRRAYVFYHSHGNIWRVLDQIVHTGVDVIHPLATEDQMDIGIVKKVFGSRVAVAGNISTDLLSRGSPADVERETRKTMEETAAGGGYVLMAAASIHSGVKPQNYRMMVDTVHRYGSYE
jgi:uroporphyrinogen decarboxylase